MLAFTMPQAEDMIRGSSRTDSISTIWSSADVPFCLDPRMTGSGQAIALTAGNPGGRLNRPDGYPRFSRGSGSSRPCSIDMERPSLSLAEERYYDYSLDLPNALALRPHQESPPSRDRLHRGERADRIAATATGGSRVYGSPPEMVPPSSSQSSSLHATLKSKRDHRLRPSEDSHNASAPSMPASVSSGSGPMSEVAPPSASCSPLARQGAGKSCKAGVSTQSSGSDSSKHASIAGGTQASPSGSSGDGGKLRRQGDLYVHARQLFEADYSMDPDRSGASLKPGSRQMVGPDDHEDGLERRERVLSSAFSDLLHEDSMHLCSASHRSDRLSSEDSSVLPDLSDSLAQAYFFGIPPVKGLSLAMAMDAGMHPSEHTPTREYPPVQLGDKAVDQSKDLATLPSLPSSPNVSPSLSGPNSPRGFASRHASRPRTADTNRGRSPNGFSPRRVVKGPPTPLKISRPMTSQAALTQALSLNTDGAQTDIRLSPPLSRDEGSPENRLPSSTGSRMRSRALSTSKLRPTSPWKLFGGGDVPALPALPALPSGLSSRPSTAQVNGQEGKPKGRFRSRTLGEVDRAVSMQPGPKVPEKRADIDMAPATTAWARRSSKSDTLASSATFSARSVLLTSASSASPSIPSTPKSPGRPRTKSGAGGWASYLTTGLTLHIDQDGQRLTQVNMSYLSYDPFGSPDALVGGAEAKQGSSAASRRPKSRQDRDGEASQVGTLEFGQGDEIHQHLWPIRSSGHKSPPILKHLTIGDDVKADLLTRQAALMVKANGDHEVGGYEQKGQLAWKFVYRVEDHANGAAAGDKLLIPVSFLCSVTLLDPARARKSRILTSLCKQVVPNLVSKSVSASPASSKHDLPPVSGSGYAPSPPSSYRSQASLRREFLAHEKTGSTSAARPSYGETMASPSPMRHRFDSHYLASSHTTFLGTPATSRPPLSANSIASTDSSILSASQPITPLSGRGTGESFSDRSRLQSSPVSPRFGKVAPSAGGVGSGGDDVSGPRRYPGSATEQGHGRHGVSPNHIGLDGATLRIRQSSLALQEKASFGSFHATGPPRMIGGRKLIPISLPPELQKRSRIDPARLQANTTTSISTARPSSRQPVAAAATASTPSLPTTSSIRPDDGIRALSSRPRSGTTSSSRPPTTSEAIKFEYLAREEQSSMRPLRSQRSHGTFILTPNSTIADHDETRTSTTTTTSRQRSRTSEGSAQVEQGRPFTADAWGAAMYPPVEAIRGTLQQERTHQTIQQQHPHPQQQLKWQEASIFLAQTGSVAQRGRPTFGRPRTAQNLMPDQTAKMPAAALVNVSTHRT